MGSVHKDSDITAIIAGGKTRLYVQNPEGGIQEYSFQDGKWLAGAQIATAKIGTPIAAVEVGNFKTIHVFYTVEQDGSNVLREMIREDGNWRAGDLDGTYYLSTRLAARLHDDKPYLYAQKVNKHIEEHVGGKWERRELPHKALPGSDISIIPHGIRKLYFLDDIMSQETFENNALKLMKEMQKIHGSLPPTRIVELSPSDNGDWIRGNFTIDGKTTNIKFAAIDLGRDGLRLYVSPGENHVSEWTYTAGAWKKSSVQKDMSDGPITAISPGRPKVYTHSDKDETQISEWSWDRSWQDKIVVPLS